MDTGEKDKREGRTQSLSGLQRAPAGQTDISINVLRRGSLVFGIGGRNGEGQGEGWSRFEGFRCLFVVGAPTKT